MTAKEFQEKIYPSGGGCDTCGYGSSVLISCSCGYDYKIEG